MFVIFGTKVKSKRLGWVADYCIICRDIRCCELVGVFEHSHLYNLSIGSGRLLGHQTRCGACGTLCPVDPGIFRSVRPSPSDVAVLLVDTQPDIRDRYAVELALSETSWRPAPEMRVELIKKPFMALAPLVEERYGATHLDRHSISVLVTMVVGVVALFCAARWGRGPGEGPRDLPWKLIGYAYLTAGAAFVALLATEPQRFVRREVVPRLARSLKVLDPSPQEIRDALHHLRNVGLKIGRKIAPRRLETAIAGVTST